MYCFFFFFFFQAEDGIRDHCVTGVQTCALPICRHSCFPPTSGSGVVLPFRSHEDRARWFHIALFASRKASQRSEERRVGKECRSRWSAYHYKKKTSDYR